MRLADYKKDFSLEKSIGQTAFVFRRGEYIPCMIMNYYFSPKKYVLVPLHDLANKVADDREVVITTKVYLLN